MVGRRLIMEYNGMTMISKIINDIKNYFKKEVVIDTRYPIDKDTRSFRLDDIEIENKIYVTTVRVNEYKDFVRVVKIDIRTVKKSNERNIKNEKSN
jgi:hypothetical protein